MSDEAERLARFIREHLEFPPESHIEIRLEGGNLVAECDACGARHEVALEELGGSGDEPPEGRVSGAPEEPDSERGGSGSGDPPPADGQEVEPSSTGDPGG